MTSYTNEQLTALKDAAAKGVLKVRNSVGEEITYRSLDELHRQIAVMEMALAPKAQPRHHFPVFDKGT